MMNPFARVFDNPSDYKPLRALPEFKWEWSEKHTRLRYQLFLAAIAFAATSIGEIKEIKFPFFNIDLTGVPSFSIPLMFFAFYIFCAYSFWVRTKNELTRSSPEIKFFSNQITSLREQIKEFQDILMIKYQAMIPIIENDLKSIKQSYDLMSSDWESFKKSVSSLSKVPQKISEHYSSALNQGMSAGEALILANAGDNHALASSASLEFQNQISWYFDEAETQAKSIHDKANSESFRNLLAALEKVDSNIQAPLHNLLHEQEQFSLSVAHTLSLQENFRELDQNLIFYRKEGVRREKSFSRERDLLGYQIPLYGSLFVVLIAVVIDFKLFDILIGLLK